MDRKHFVENLQKSGIVISVENLINLAVYEPSTFSCLVEVAHRYEHEVIWSKNGVAPEVNSLSNLPDYS